MSQPSETSVWVASNWYVTSYVVLPGTYLFVLVTERLKELNRIINMEFVCFVMWSFLFKISALQYYWIDFLRIIYIYSKSS